MTMLKRRTFLKAVAAGAAMGSRQVLGAGTGAVRLRVGFLSDTHVTPKPQSASRVAAAMRLFRRLGTDVVAHVGDLADWRYPEGWAHYRAAAEAAFPRSGKRPEFLYAFGNHDALNPAAQKDPGVPRMLDPLESFQAMKQALGITHGYHDFREIGGYPFLIFPQSFEQGYGIEDYEREIARVCAAYSGRPVFVLEHEPSYNTTYNSSFCGVRRRAVLDRYPQVIEISGHKHSSVFNEAAIWQGTFTSVQISCLQSWYGLNVGDVVRGKQSAGVAVMEIYDHEIVFRRIDVETGYESPKPWVLPLPLLQQQPYARDMRVAQERVAGYADGGAIEVSPDKLPFGAVEICFPSVPAAEEVMVYRVEILRQEQGAWTPCARRDVFGEFYLSPNRRTGRLGCSFLSSQFEAGTAYRFRVTPQGFFGKMGKPIETAWTAPAKAPSTVLWKLADPMTSPKSVARGVFKLPIPLSAAEVAGKVVRVTAEVRTVSTHPDLLTGPALGIGDKVIWSSGYLAPAGDSGWLTYVFDLKGKKVRELVFGVNQFESYSVQVRALKVEALA